MPIMQPTMPQRENIGISAHLFEVMKLKHNGLCAEISCRLLPETVRKV